MNFIMCQLDSFPIEVVQFNCATCTRSSKRCSIKMHVRKYVRITEILCANKSQPKIWYDLAMLLCAYVIDGPTIEHTDDVLNGWC